jgi:CRISP-associated protein Cas1
MATLYLVEQGTNIYKNHQRLIVEVSDTEKLQIPLNEVERVLLFGNINLTTPVINTCLLNKIMVLFLSPSGLYRGHLWSEESLNLATHLTQFDKHNDAVFQFNISRAIVFGKLTNSKQFLLRLNRQRKSDEVKKAIAGITADLEALKTVDNLDSLRGYEGISAARYFPAFGDLITNPNFSFSLRNRQPPEDPVNSLLSFGYTLLFNNVLSLIIAEGLSPYLGNFHYGEKKKPYLAFDLMEEFRSPIVDSLVMKIINNNWLKPTDFERVKNGGIYITGEGKKLFIKHFENRMNETLSYPSLISPVTYRQIIQLQIRKYKKSLLDSVAYESFLRSS